MAGVVSWSVLFATGANASTSTVTGPSSIGNMLLLLKAVKTQEICIHSMAYQNSVIRSCEYNKT